MEIAEAEKEDSMETHLERPIIKEEKGEEEGFQAPLAEELEMVTNED